MNPALPWLSLSRQTFAWLAAGPSVMILAVLAVFIAPILLVAVPLLVIAGLALLRWPWLGVVLLIASVPAQQAGAVAGLTLTRAALVAACLGLFLWWTVGNRPVVSNRLIWPFVALFAWMLVTTFVARDLGAAAADVFRWSVALFAFFAVLQVLTNTSKRVLTTIIVAVALAGAVEAGVGAALGLLGFGPESFVIDDAFARAYGTFGRPNTFAGYLEMALFPVLWFGLYRLRDLNGRLRTYVVARRAGFATSADRRRELAFAAVVTAILLGSAAIMLAGIAISFSRGGWLGMTAGMAVTMLIAVRRYWRLVLPALPVAALLGLAVLAVFAPATLTERVSSISEEARPFDASSITITPENFAVVERMAHWQAGWHMFEDHPVTGVGAGNFNARYPDYYVRETFRVSQGHAHNFYIHMLAENGLVGLAIYLTLILSFAFVALRVALASRDPLASALALGALGTMTAVYVHNTFENLHVLNLGVQLSFTWALAIVAHDRWLAVRRATTLDGVEYSGR